MENKIKFALFCTEVYQCGIALSEKELELIFNAAEKLEGFNDKDFEGKKMDQFLEQAKRNVGMIQKRKALVESLTFQLITKKSVDELIHDEESDGGLRDYVMKAKHLASIMADEFMEKDERLEKVVKDGRRVIEVFIDQWKAMKQESTSTDEIIEPEVVE